MSAQEMSQPLGLELDHAANLARPGSAPALLRWLEGLRGGHIELTLPDGSHGIVGDGGALVDLTVEDWRLFDAVAARADIGLAQGFLAGWWRSADLAGLLTLLARNGASSRPFAHGQWWRPLAEWVRHAVRAHPADVSLQRIVDRHELDNGFYRLWLDPTMTFSGALFRGETMRGLASAQRAKYRRILEQLGAAPGERILEIGCGWGGFAEVAAREFGCQVHGITLSRQEIDYARERSRRRGFADGVRFDLCDYREVKGTFDHVVSIEMLASIGERHWPAFFQTVRERLGGGKAVVQTATIADDLFRDHRRRTGFVRRCILLGGTLPSAPAFRKQAARAQLAVDDAFAFGADYAHTLRCWRERFAANREAVAARGFEPAFMRFWRFCLAYCEAAFNTGAADLYQFTLKRSNRG